METNNNKNNNDNFYVNVSVDSNAVKAAKNLGQIEDFLFERDKKEFKKIHEHFIDPLRCIIQEKLGFDAYYSIIDEEEL